MLTKLKSKLGGMFSNPMTDKEKVEYEQSVLKYERLLRLKENKDFKEFILDGFIQETILQSASQLAWADEIGKKDIFIQIEASALLTKFMRIIEDEGIAAKQILGEEI
jgi:hypothetical protein